jgi:hypothetical protein
MTKPLLNTFARVGIDPAPYLTRTGTVTVNNRFTGTPCTTSPLNAYLIEWVYETNDAYDRGGCTVRLSDFDRIRYFIAKEDNNAYMNCLD